MRKRNYAEDGLAFSLRVDLSVPPHEVAGVAGGESDAGAARQLRAVLARYAVVALRFAVRVCVLAPLAVVAGCLFAGDLCRAWWDVAGHLADEVIARVRRAL